MSWRFFVGGGALGDTVVVFLSPLGFLSAVVVVVVAVVCVCERD